MRIALLFFGISSISNISGTEKVFVDMANAFIQRGHEVYSIWNDDLGIKPYYPLDDRIKQINVGLGKIRIPFLYKLQRECCKGCHLPIVNQVDLYKTKLLCREIKKRIDIPSIDVFICYEFNSVMVANQLSNKKIPVIAMVHNSIENQIGMLTSIQRAEASKVDVYQVLQPDFVAKASQLLNTRICYIPNCIPQVDSSQCADLTSIKSKYTIVFLGRIDKTQKRPLIAIQAFGHLAHLFPNWQLLYYGPITDSSYKQEIDTYILQHKLQNQIQYKGVVSSSLDILRQADILVFPSAYEGFGLVLGEASSVGIPSIGFSYAAAVNNLIIDGVTGYLAHDEREYIRKLKLLIESRELRISMGNKAREYVNQYAPKKIWDSWENLIHDVITHHRQ